MKEAAKKKRKSKKDTYATIRVNRKTLKKCKVNKIQTGVAIGAFIDAAVDEKLERQRVGLNYRN